MKEQQHKRGTWSSNFGFLMAAIGSAVGLGNMWGFPYKLGMNGGFAFLILYLLLAVFAGYILTMTELALGRSGIQIHSQTVRIRRMAGYALAVPDSGILLLLGRLLH